MKMPYGKYRGMEMSALPLDYLKWIVQNFEAGEILEEAKRILASPELRQEMNAKSLEQQANELLGEKPVGLLWRGRSKRRR